MLKEELIKYLENPSTLNDYSMSELSALIRKYPFFQTTYALFVLNLKNIGDPRFREYLEKYSVFIKDREKVFQQLNILESYSASYFENITPEVDPSGTRTIEEENTQAQSGQKVDIHPEEEKVPPRKKRRFPEKKEFSTEYLRSRIDRTLSQQRNEAGTEDQESNEEVNEFFILDKADQLTERVAQRYPREESQQPEKTDKSLSDATSDEMFELDDSKETAEASDKTVKDKSSGNDKQKIITGGQYFSNTEYSPENQKHRDLVDQFLENDPEIEKIEPKEEKGEDISLDSVEEREDFLTEKLAQLYIKQGYFNKAIDAYEKLSLKYPEKSDYFAEQIERVKQLNSEQ